jgi:hypothetical protein
VQYVKTPLIVRAAWLPSECTALVDETLGAAERVEALRELATAAHLDLTTLARPPAPLGQWRAAS